MTMSSLSSSEPGAKDPRATARERINTIVKNDRENELRFVRWMLNPNEKLKGNMGGLRSFAQGSSLGKTHSF
jgi:hypothetical protein